MFSVVEDFLIKNTSGELLIKRVREKNDTYYDKVFGIFYGYGVYKNSFRISGM